MSQSDWRQQVMQRAIERSGGNPEEGDFNAAMIELHEIVPAEELRLLQQDLESVEPYDPSDYYDDEDIYYYHEDDYLDEEDCLSCGSPPEWCECV